MPVILGGVQYFRTAEVCRMAGISKSTLFRWLDDGTMDIAVPRDRRNWRLFDGAQVELLKKEAGRTGPLERV